jgi:hypothetical protein
VVESKFKIDLTKSKAVFHIIVRIDKLIDEDVIWRLILTFGFISKI